MAVPTVVGLIVTIVVTQCLAAWEHTPPIPAGRRAQYYLLRQDGGYKYGFDTGDGQTAQAVADNANEVQGKFSFTGSSGDAQELEYTAGIGGYVPRSSSRGKSQYIGTSYVLPFHDSSASTSQADNSNTDASYSFNIDTDGYKRQESSDAKGNIKGQYSYSSAAGGNHQVNYIAGAGTGFVATSDGISTGSNVDVPFNSPQISTGDASYNFGYSATGHSRKEESDNAGNVKGSYTYLSGDGVERKVDYEAGGEKGFVIKGVTSNKLKLFDVNTAENKNRYNAGSSWNTDNIVAGDAGSQSGAYSFGYNAVNHDRQESADANGNVRGTYSFVSKDDGVRRTVNYEAGSKSGFVAQGAHLPTQENPPSVYSPVLKFSPVQSHAPIVPVYVSPVVLQTNAYSGQYIAPIQSHVQETEQSGDASYSFGYETDDQSRRESSDAKGNVKGSYSYVAKDDGVRRTVDYEAGAGKGYEVKSSETQANTKQSQAYNALIEGQSQTSDTGKKPNGAYAFSYDTGDQTRQESADENGNVQGSYSFVAKNDGVRRTVNYEANSASGFLAKGEHLPTPVTSASAQNVQSSVQSTVYNAAQKDLSKDSAYSYSYKTDSSSKQESSDAQGNVVGSFNYISGDGINRNVQYTADSQGFVATGEHLPRNEFATQLLQVGTKSAGVNYVATQNAQNEGGGDSSYSYSYNTDSSSKQESSDAQGNVVGSYSYIGGDGINRNIKYTAGSQGFIASGEHLPQPEPVQFSSIGSKSGLNYVATQNTQNEAGGDNSYAYSYNTDSSSKQESSDPQGNVVGSYSYIGSDGVNRNIQYTANEKGFVAKGEHLPQAISLNDGSSVKSSIPLQTTSYSSGSFVKTALPGFTVQTYLPPNDHHKYGYIYDTKY